jgi:hypothetical protein
MKNLLLKITTWLYSLTYERMELDKVNSKMIRPVQGLVIDGVQYYEFVNVSDMPQARFVHYQHLRQELSMGMDRELSNKYLEEMKLTLNEEPADKSRLGALIDMMQDTINNCTPLEALYNLAALVYFDKKEDISCFDGDYNAAKIAAFKKLPDQGFFFARLLREGLKVAGGTSPDDTEKYLRQSAVKLRGYSQMLFAERVRKASETLNEQ